MTRLREEREQRGWTKTSLVHKLERAAAAQGVGVATRKSLLRMLAQWENGHREVGEPYRTLMPIVYRLEPAELGLGASSNGTNSKLGLGFESSLAATLVIVEELAKYDLLGHTAIVQGKFAPDALNAAVLDWMFAAPSSDVEGGRREVTARHVAEVQATTQAFDRLDRQFGGEHSRELATKYLRDAVVPMLRGRYAEGVGHDLFSAAAALCELIGWMAYDADRHALAQRYFTQGLRLASQAGDDAYGAFLLASMGHQALYLKQPAQALRLAQAAYDRSSRTSSAAMLTEAAFLTARAYSELGDASGCGSALKRAEDAYERIRPDTEPAWATNIDETIFASHAGTCWTRLDRPAQALPFLRTLWDNSADQARRRAYAAVQLATVADQEGDLERAGMLGIQAAEAISQVPSARSKHELAALLRRLETKKDHPLIRDLHERARLVLAD
ncbi:hypothetical protein [Longispora fulva]|uniref:Transcriptional regulator with XRE-family HTH domain n=1 Tax=Longispora fulva TaxID=619741 RepID=A0A8J7GKF5_9ACTN|nr:hypothetical protein [Longispora fulva]MBG6139285.1 transcriptional regulator with XRE-family HTH domain [Longispora fulva]